MSSITKYRPRWRRKSPVAALCFSLLVAAIGVSCESGPRHAAPAPVGDPPPALGPGGAQTSEQQAALIEWLAYHASREQMKSGIPASVTIAQAILETGWLRANTPTRRRMLYRAKNLFGIKGAGPAGHVEIETHEYVGGRSVRITAKFRAYDTYRESFEDRTRLLMTSHYYSGALKYRDNPRLYIREVAKKYATDPAYAEKVWSIVKRYDLTRFDSPE